MAQGRIVLAGGPYCEEKMGNSRIRTGSRERAYIHPTIGITTGLIEMRLGGEGEGEGDLGEERGIKKNGEGW